MVALLLYLVFMQIEWMESGEEKVQIAKALVNKYPNYAPAWTVIAGKSDSNEERLAAVEKGVASSPDAETKGMLLINEALVRQLPFTQCVVDRPGAPPICAARYGGYLA